MSAKFSTPKYQKLLQTLTATVKCLGILFCSVDIEWFLELAALASCYAGFTKCKVTSTAVVEEEEITFEGIRTPTMQLVCRATATIGVLPQIKQSVYQTAFCPSAKSFILY
ncbi:MAG: hypothetical protein ACXVCP_13975 [Bdellovibrio sp.]